MGLFNRVGEFFGGKDWAKETAKLGQEEKEQLKKKQAEAEEQKRGEEIMRQLAGEALRESKMAKEAPKTEKLSEMEIVEHLIEPKKEKESEEELYQAFFERTSGWGEAEETDMLDSFAAELGSNFTTKAAKRLNKSGELVDKGIQGFWGKLKEGAKLGLTAAYKIPVEMGKFAFGQVADVTKGLGEGIKEFPAAAWSEMQGAGYSIGEFAQLRVAKPATEIYGRYSDEIGKSLGIGAGVAATKYEAASEWVGLKSIQARDKGVMAYGNLKAEVGAVKKGALRTWSEWQKARDEEKLAKLAEIKFKKFGDYAKADAKLRQFKLELEKKAA